MKKRLRLKIKRQIEKRKFKVVTTRHGYGAVQFKHQSDYHHWLKSFHTHMGCSNIRRLYNAVHKDELVSFLTLIEECDAYGVYTKKRSNNIPRL